MTIRLNRWFRRNNPGGRENIDRNSSTFMPLSISNPWSPRRRHAGLYRGVIRHRERVQTKVGLNLPRWYHKGWERDVIWHEGRVQTKVGLNLLPRGGESPCRVPLVIRRAWPGLIACTMERGRKPNGVRTRSNDTFVDETLLGMRDAFTELMQARELLTSMICISVFALIFSIEALADATINKNSINMFTYTLLCIFIDTTRISSSITTH